MAPDADAKGSGWGWRAVELAGAATGFALMLYAVGGVLLALRFRSLELPAEDTVALLPTGFLVVAGVKALVPGAALGSVLALAVARAGAVPVTSKRARLGLAGLLVFPLVLVALLQELTWGARLGMVGAGVLAVFAAVRSLRQAQTRRPLIYLLATIGVVLGATLNALLSASPPDRLSSATIVFKDGYRTGGYYLGSSKTDVLIAPSLDGKIVGEVAVLPRDEIDKIALSPNERGVRPLHGASSHALIGGERDESQRAPRAKDEKTLIDYVAYVRADPMWVHPPIAPTRSINTLRDPQYYSEFMERKVHRWEDRGLATTPLNEVASDPRFFTLFHTQGTIKYSSSEKNADGTWTYFIAIEAETEPYARAMCPVTLAHEALMGYGSQVEIRGVLVAFGGIAATSRGTVPALWMVCSTARVTPAA